jgi:hypothetical protein
VDSSAKGSRENSLTPLAGDLVSVVIHKSDIGATLGCKSSGSQRRGETTSLLNSFLRPRAGSEEGAEGKW